MTFSSPVLALVGDTFRESLSRKIFWGFLGCSTVLILLFLLVLNIDLVEGGVAAVEVFSMEVNQGRTVPVEELVGFVLGAVASFLFTAGLFLAIFAAAGLIPTVFEPGRIELLLSKPVSRPTLLLAKVLGTLAVIGVNLFYLVLGVWIILGFKTEIWKADFSAGGRAGDVRFCCPAAGNRLRGCSFGQRGAGDDGDVFRGAHEPDLLATRAHRSLF